MANDATWAAYCKERHAGTGQSSTAIATRGSQATLVGTVDDEHLVPLMQAGLDKATTKRSTSGLRRQTPIAHPRFPWLFLDSFSNLVGKSFVEKADAEVPKGVPLEAVAVPHYCRYHEWELTASFSARPYSVLDDDALDLHELVYYDDNGDEQTTEVVDEWNRYVQTLTTPTSEYLTADQGDFRLAKRCGGRGVTRPRRAPKQGDHRPGADQDSNAGAMLPADLERGPVLVCSVRE